MIKKLFFIISLAILITAGSFLLPVRIYSGSGTPIFDGNDGTASLLSLISCGRSENDIDGDHDVLGEGIGLKSKKWTDFNEYWRGTHGSIDIYRTYFQYPEDAFRFAEKTDTNPVYRSVKWSREIGDGNYWRGNQRVVFVKGKWLVSVFVNSKSPSFGKEYVKKIAEIIEKKL